MANRLKNCALYQELLLTFLKIIPLLVLAIVVFPQSARGQTLKTILTFNGATDGAYSSSGLVPDHKGNLYGTTQAGGIFNFNGGTVFSVDLGGAETVLHSFCAESNCGDGSTPYGGVILDTLGNLYGATSGGGRYDDGVVFSLSPAGEETVLYSFKGLAAGDGTAPAYGSLVRDGEGTLYGATLNGGEACTYTSAGCGVVYKIDTTGKETILHRFSGGDDGGLPPANPIYAGGTLYGTTFRGGTNGCGTVYSIGTKGFLKIVYNFSCSVGGWGPNAGLTWDSNDTLYGTTSFGGFRSEGTIFKLVPSTGIATFLYDFQGGTIDGCVPGLGSLTLDPAGNIYGITSFCGANGFGIIFELDSTGTETVLYNFPGGAYGGTPQSTLLRTVTGDFFGTTYFSGDLSCCGTVFEFTP